MIMQKINDNNSLRDHKQVLSAIGRWVKPEQGSLSPSTTKKSVLNLTDQGELTWLRKEVEQLRMEREILQGAL